MPWISRRGNRGLDRLFPLIKVSQLVTSQVTPLCGLQDHALTHDTTVPQQRVLMPGVHAPHWSVLLGGPGAARLRGRGWRTRLEAWHLGSKACGSLRGSREIMERLNVTKPVPRGKTWAARAHGCFVLSCPRMLSFALGLSPRSPLPAGGWHRSHSWSL